MATKGQERLERTYALCSALPALNYEIIYDIYLRYVRPDGTRFVEIFNELRGRGLADSTQDGLNVMPNHAPHRRELVSTLSVPGYFGALWVGVSHWLGVYSGLFNLEDEQLKEKLAVLGIIQNIYQRDLFDLLESPEQKVERYTRLIPRGQLWTYNDLARAANLNAPYVGTAIRKIEVIQDKWASGRAPTHRLVASTGEFRGDGQLNRLEDEKWLAGETARVVDFGVDTVRGKKILAGAFLMHGMWKMPQEVKSQL